MRNGLRLLKKLEPLLMFAQNSVFGKADFIELWEVYGSDKVRDRTKKVLTGTEPQRCSKIWQTVDCRKCLKSKGNSLKYRQIHNSWFCQNCWHIANTDVFYFKAYFESAKAFCRMDTTNIDRWEKIGYVYKPLSKFNQRRFIHILNYDETLDHYFEPVRNI